MDRPLPGDGPIGEAWILSDRDDHPSVVAEGPLKGRTLPDLMAEHREAILGELAGRCSRFPLLLKFLDVAKMLSVQVHPRDDQRDLIPPGESGKTEAWVVLAAEPKARIYAGLKAGVTAEGLRALSTATVETCLSSFSPAVGQAVLIEAGTAHALGDGVLVFEVQENSDVTFRVYDWDHVDPATGRPRDLQVDKALACIDFKRGPVGPIDPSPQGSGAGRSESLLSDKHFHVRRLHGPGSFAVGAEGSPRVLVGVRGAASLRVGGGTFWIRQGEVLLLPASLGPQTVHADEESVILETAPPEAE
jgi:mannose-6-phosphate isomerase